MSPPRPKPRRSVCKTLMPHFLAEEAGDHLRLFPKREDERIFEFSKSYLHHEMDCGAQEENVE